MNTNELLKRILDLLPEATIEEDGDGMLVINTYLTACDTCAELINSDTHLEESGLCQSCSELFYESGTQPWILN